MADREVVNYVRESLRKGTPETAVRKALTRAGWDEGQIDNAIDYVQKGRIKLRPLGSPDRPAPEPVPVPEEVRVEEKHKSTRSFSIGHIMSVVILLIGLVVWAAYSVAGVVLVIIGIIGLIGSVLVKPKRKAGK